MKKFLILATLAIFCMNTATAEHSYKRVAKQSYMKKICFSFSPQNVTSDWEKALKKAVSQYNRAFNYNSNINFCYSPPGTCGFNATFHVDIVIDDYGKSANDPYNGWVGYASTPSWRGKPGDWIKINTGHYQMSQHYDVDTKAALLMYEMGIILA